MNFSIQSEEIKEYQPSNNISKVSEEFISPLKLAQLDDLEWNEELYLNDFEVFSQSKKDSESYNRVTLKSRYSNKIDKIDEKQQDFDQILMKNWEDTLFMSIKDIDKSKAFEEIFKKTKLSDLSGEVMKIAGFVKAIPLLSSEKKEASITFLISLDYLVKGLFTHWQITLMDESKKSKHSRIRKKMQEDALIIKNDIKYNILIGDQFHAKAYYLTTRLGNNELSSILTRIEENFSKIIFRDGYNGNKKHNLKKLYKHFYNYLPTFFGQGFKGIAIISEMKSASIDHSLKLGIEYGFWIQFGIFSYIMSAIENRKDRDLVKLKLKKISSLVQLLSLETLQEVLKSISIFSYKDLKNEFSNLSIMHSHKWYKILEEMDVDEEMKVKMMSHINEFTKELISITGSKE